MAYGNLPSACEACGFDEQEEREDPDPWTCEHGHLMPVRSRFDDETWEFLRHEASIGKVSVSWPDERWHDPFEGPRVFLKWWRPRGVEGSIEVTGRRLQTILAMKREVR
jgi:hypothetical protein